MVDIVKETPEHYLAVRELTTSAFAASEFGHNGEAELIETLRQEFSNIISLVAIENRVVVGHILFSPAKLSAAENREFEGWALAPLSVLPTRQNRGIGSMLVKKGLEVTQQTDAEFTVVVGHPEFYARLGFQSARQHSISHGFTGMPQDLLLIQVRHEAVATKMQHGLIYYSHAFGNQFAD